MFGLIYVSMSGAEGTLSSSMHACKRLPGVHSMQSDGLPTGEQACCGLGRLYQQA